MAIEKVHVKFCKFILGVNKRSVNLAVKGEMGRFPVSFSSILQAFKYWYHFQESSNSLLREASSVCRDLHDKGVSTWFSFYDSISKSINIKADDPSVMLQSFLYEKFRIYWSNTISSFSKLKTNVSFKSKFCMEGYFDTILNRTHRIWYTKIRISNQSFAVKTGSFSKITRDERLCLFCKTKKKE